MVRQFLTHEPVQVGVEPGQDSLGGRTTVVTAQNESVKDVERERRGRVFGE